LRDALANCATPRKYYAKIVNISDSANFDIADYLMISTRLWMAKRA